MELIFKIASSVISSTSEPLLSELPAVIFSENVSQIIFKEIKMEGKEAGMFEYPTNVLTNYL